MESEMKTPKEMAKYLIRKFNLIVLDTALGGSNARVIKCAIIAVNRIIEELDSERVFERIDYWNELKEELKKL